MSERKDDHFSSKNSRINLENYGDTPRELRVRKEICGFLGSLKTLLRYSVTTGATSIAIRIDLEYPFLQIADNGVGIARSEISEIGKTTLVPVIAAAEEVSIETMTKSMEESAIMKFHNKVLLEPKSKKVAQGDGCFDWLHSATSRKSPKEIPCSAQSPCHLRESVGTTFTLTNVHLSVAEQFEKFGKDIVNYVRGFAIAHYQMSITLKDLKGNKLLFGVKKAKSITEKVTSIYNLDGMGFNSMSKSSNNIAIEVFWGTKLHHSSHIQLVFVNGEPNTNNRLLKTIKKAWKCGSLKYHPIYILQIRITGDIAHLFNDSVIKDCIQECVENLKSTIVEEDEVCDDNLSKEDETVYLRPHLLIEATKQSSKKERQYTKVSDEVADSSVFAVPLPPKRRENRVPLSPNHTPSLHSHNHFMPQPNTTNISLNYSRSPRQYLQTCASSVQSAQPSALGTVLPQSQNNIQHMNNLSPFNIRANSIHGSTLLEVPRDRNLQSGRLSSIFNTSLPFIMPSPIQTGSFEISPVSAVETDLFQQQQVPQDWENLIPRSALRTRLIQDARPSLEQSDPTINSRPRRSSGQFIPSSPIATLCEPFNPHDQTAYLAHLEDQTKRLSSQVNYLRNAVQVIEELREVRERDRRRIRQLTNENQELIFNQESSRAPPIITGSSHHGSTIVPVGREMISSRQPQRQDSLGVINIYNSQVTVHNGNGSSGVEPLHRSQ